MNRLLIAAVLVFTARFAVAADAGSPSYNRDVRPILQEHCFTCHGPDSAARKADLRLDRRDDAVKAGAIDLTDADQSEMLVRILSDDPDEIMPPPKTKKKLSAHEKDVIRRWIVAGAAYEPHWSFIPPKRPPLPHVKNEAWVKNPIDRFILEKLEANGLEPAPEADRRTLARRLSLDLTGLPPAVEEVEQFVNDAAPNAYEKLVDRLLASPRWGEHRGRYWLDAARYADTHGIHFDNYREMWSYRDRVFASFNRNIPFDQFTVEQLAGDLIPHATLEQKISSGFNRCNITTNEGGAIDEEYRVLYDRDRAETTAQVWLGMTAGCAVCHDHKYDPLSQREFYSFAAYFNNTTQNAMDGNIKDTPPILFVPKPADRPRWDSIDGEIAAAKAKVVERKMAARAEFDRWLATLKPNEFPAKIPTDSLAFHAPLSEGNGGPLQIQVEGKPRSIDLSAGTKWKPGKIADQAFVARPGVEVAIAEPGDFDTNQPFSHGVWIQIPKREITGSAYARMDERDDHRGWDLWIENGRVATHIIHKWPEKALKVVAREPLKPGEWTHILVVYDGSAKAEGVKIYYNGESKAVEYPVNALAETIRTKTPFKLAQRSEGSRLDDIALQDLRIYGRALTTDEIQAIARTSIVQAIAAKPVDKRTDSEKNDLFAWWLATLDDSYKSADHRVNDLSRERSEIESRGTKAHVMNERNEPAAAYVLYRGEYDKRRDKVEPGVPAILPPMPADYPKNRLGLARWLVSNEHPLTARVTVNRFWQELFGSGIVRTTGDFGITGEAPSHPELLDYLAVDFRESGWNVKQFYKFMVMSATYRQSAAATPAKIEKDPANRLLSRGPRFRMDAEMIRDYALDVSGLLSPKIGGPSVRPYQPEGVWEAVAMPESNTRNYRRDHGESLYRRSVYTLWKRAAPPASMDVFNAPSREVCTVRRERTDTPLQALVTLNDEQYVEAARNLAQIALKKGGATNESKLDMIARRLLSRSFSAEENRIALASLEQILAHYKNHVDDAKKLLETGESPRDGSLDPAEHAAWTMLCNELMNLDEVLNK